MGLPVAVGSVQVSQTRSLPTLCGTPSAGPAPVLSATALARSLPLGPEEKVSCAAPRAAGRWERPQARRSEAVAGRPSLPGGPSGCLCPVSATSSTLVFICLTCEPGPWAASLMSTLCPV